MESAKKYMDTAYPGVLASLVAKPVEGDGEGYSLEAEILKDGHTHKVYVDEELVGSTEFRELKTLSPIALGLGDAPYTLVEKGEEKTFNNTGEMVEYVFAAGKKGLGIQRYKGLGEMNPEQLWETTMMPEKRLLLQVKVDDAYTADEIFSTLMGEDVEPRKLFLQGHAMEVRNLDI